MIPPLNLNALIFKASIIMGHTLQAPRVARLIRVYCSYLRITFFQQCLLIFVANYYKSYAQHAPPGKLDQVCKEEHLESILAHVQNWDALVTRFISNEMKIMMMEYVDEGNQGNR